MQLAVKENYFATINNNFLLILNFFKLISSEFCEIFKKTYFYITPVVAAFGQQKGLLMLAHFIDLPEFQ